MPLQVGYHYALVKHPGVHRLSHLEDLGHKEEDAGSKWRW